MIGILQQVQVVAQPVVATFTEVGWHLQVFQALRIEARPPVERAMVFHADGKQQLRRTLLVEVLQHLVGQCGVADEQADDVVLGKFAVVDEGIKAYLLEGLATIPEHAGIGMDGGCPVTLAAEGAHDAGDGPVGDFVVRILHAREKGEGKPGQHLELGADGAAGIGRHRHFTGQAALGQAMVVRQVGACGCIAQARRIEQGFTLHNDDVRARVARHRPSGMIGVLACAQFLGMFAQQAHGSGAVGLQILATRQLPVVQHQIADNTRLACAVHHRPRSKLQAFGAVHHAPRRPAHQQSRGHDEGEGGKRQPAPTTHGRPRGFAHQGQGQEQDHCDNQQDHSAGAEVMGEQWPG